MYIPNHSKNFRKSSENHCWLKRVYFDPFQVHVDLPLSMLLLDLKVSSIIFLSVPFTEVQATTWASLVFACLICHETSLGLINLPSPVRMKQPREFVLLWINTRVEHVIFFFQLYLFPWLAFELEWNEKVPFFVFGLLLLSAVKLYFILSSTKLNLCQQTDFNGSHQTKLFTKRQINGKNPKIVLYNDT